MHMIGPVTETERRLPHVRSLCLIKEDRYDGWLKFIVEGCLMTEFVRHNEF